VPWPGYPWIMPVVPTTATLPSVVHAGDRSFARSELVELTSARRVRTAISRGEIRAVLPGRYASAIHSPSFLVRAHAAIAATRGTVTGSAALFVRGADSRPPRVIDLAARHGVNVATREWMRVCGTRTPPRASPVGHLRVATPDDAIIHAWRREAADRRASLVIESLRLKLVTPEGLRRAVARRQRLRDRAALNETIDAYESGAHSYLEYEGLVSTFSGPEFRRFARQHHVEARGFDFWLDMYDPATRTAVELDGDKHHAVGERRQYDIRRDADLATIGIQTLRFSYDDVTRRPHWCQDTVLQVLAARGQRHGTAP